MNPLDLSRRGVAFAGELVLHGWPRYVQPLLRELVTRPPIREILPGVHHWTSVHPRIRQPVGSYYFAPAHLVIDPLVPREGLEWFEHHPVDQVVLTNRHHLRHAARFAERFGCVVRASEPGLHEFADGPEVVAFGFGDQLAPRVTAVEVGAICPDDTALHLDTGAGALVFADALTRPGGRLTYVPDLLMGEDAEQVKRDLDASLGRLLDLVEFDALLFAHGDPVLRDGRAALRDFLDRRR